MGKKKGKAKAKARAQAAAGEDDGAAMMDGEAAAGTVEAVVAAEGASLPEKRVVDSDPEDQEEEEPIDAEAKPVAKDLVDLAAGKKKDIHRLSNCVLDDGTVDPALWKQTQTRILTMSGLERLPARIRLLSDLVELNLSGGKLTVLPKAMENLKSLRSLDVDNNMLRRLPNAVLGLPLLETLSACNNQISRLGMLPPLPPAVESLSAAEQRAAARGEEVFKPSALTVVKLDSNLLEAAELASAADFARLPRLQVFSVANNKLDAIPADISDAVGLQELYLAGNPLLRVPATLASLIAGGGAKGKGKSAHGVGGGKLKNMSLSEEHLKDRKAAKTWEQNGGNAGGAKAVQQLLKYLERFLAREAAQQKAAVEARRQRALEAEKQEAEQAAAAEEEKLSPEELAAREEAAAEQKRIAKEKREQLEKEMAARQDANRKRYEEQQAKQEAKREVKEERKAQRTAGTYANDELVDFMDEKERAAWELKRAAELKAEAERLAAEEEQRRIAAEAQAEKNRLKMEAEEKRRKERAARLEAAGGAGRGGKGAGRGGGGAGRGRGSGGPPELPPGAVKLFVSGLPKDAEPFAVASLLKRDCAAFGTVLDAFAPRNHEAGGGNRGFGFVTFSDAEGARKCTEGLTKYNVRPAKEN